MSDGLHNWGQRATDEWLRNERSLSLVRPINPATEWSEQPQTTAVEYRPHIRAVVGAAGDQRKPAWGLVELIPVGEEPGQTRPLVLAAAAFRLCWISMLAQSRDVLRW